MPAMYKLEARDKCGRWHHVVDVEDKKMVLVTVTGKHEWLDQFMRAGYRWTECPKVEFSYASDREKRKGRKRRA